MSTEGIGIARLSVEARILGVAEIFEALCTETPYRGALTKEDSIHAMRKETPHQLDPNCLAALV